MRMGREAARQAFPWPLIGGYTPSPDSPWPPDKNADRDRPREPLHSSLLLLVPTSPPTFLSHGSRQTRFPSLPHTPVPNTSSPPDPPQLGSAGAGANSIYRPGPDRPARMRRRLTPRTAPSPPPPAPAQLARARRALPSVRAGAEWPHGCPPRPCSSAPAGASPARAAAAAPERLLPRAGCPPRTPACLPVHACFPLTRALGSRAVRLRFSSAFWEKQRGPAQAGAGGVRGGGTPSPLRGTASGSLRARPSGRRGAARSGPMAGKDSSTTWSGRRM